jgi:hypothetical protein
MCYKYVMIKEIEKISGNSDLSQCPVLAQASNVF